MLTVYGIETYCHCRRQTHCQQVATVLTVYGMRRRVRDGRGAKRRWGPHFSYLNEARVKQRWWGNSTYRLRYAPKGVRQQRSEATMKSALLLPEQSEGKTKLIRQQSLPFTVLKHRLHTFITSEFRDSCNSAYRLRYAQKGAGQQRSKATMRSVLLLPWAKRR